MIDWADEDRAWLQLSRAGLLSGGVSPRQLREAHEAVEHERELKEQADAMYRAWTGAPPVESRETVELSRQEPAAQRDDWTETAMATYGQR